MEEKIEQEAQININEEIEKLKQEKESILQAQSEQAKQLEELNKLKAEIEELKKYTFPQDIKPVSHLEEIRSKFDRVARAVEENYPLNHPERMLPTDMKYNGVNYLEAYYDYINGIPLEEIFKNPFN